MEIEMAYETITTERDESTFIITLNRPDKLNAINTTLQTDVVAALNSVRHDPAVRAIVIWGGAKVFAAGADISGFVGATGSDMLRTFGDDSMWETTAGMPQPTIAAIAGYALGGGCELAMACDFRLAAENAKFGQPEIKIGVIPGAGGTQRLARLVGMSKAKEMVFLGDPIGAAEAYRIGLVNKVVPVDSLLDEAKAWGKKLSALPPIGLQMAKQAMDKGYDLSLQNGLTIERLAFANLFGTEDQKEGAKAFVEKRKPEYKGK
jgi:enoyl-CoA hydratase/carnithine racemase